MLGVVWGLTLLVQYVLLDDIAVYIGTLSVCLEYNVGNF